MPSTILDSAVFRDIFTTEKMRTVFSDENRVQKYLDFEAALARAQGKLGIIPKEATTEIVLHVRGDGATLDDGTPIAGTVLELIASTAFLRALIHDAEGHPINASGRQRHPTDRQCNRVRGGTDASQRNVDRADPYRAFTDGNVTAGTRDPDLDRRDDASRCRVDTRDGSVSLIE